MKDLVERLNKLKNNAQYRNDHGASTSELWRILKDCSILAGLAADRIEELEAWAIARDNEQGKKIEKLNSRKAIELLGEWINEVEDVENRHLLAAAIDVIKEVEQSQIALQNPFNSRIEELEAENEKLKNPEIPWDKNNDKLIDYGPNED